MGLERERERERERGYPAEFVPLQRLPTCLSSPCSPGTLGRLRRAGTPEWRMSALSLGESTAYSCTDFGWKSHRETLQS